MRIQRGGEYFMCNFAFRRLEERKLCPAREEAGCARFVVCDVSLFVREDDSVGGAQGRQAQGVRGSARRNRKSAHRGREIRAQTVIEAPRPAVLTVSLHQPLVCFRQGGEDLRRGGPRVITQETQVL